MVTSTISRQQYQRGWFDVLDDLNEIALSLWVGLDSFFFPLLIWQLVTGTTFATVSVHPRTRE